MAVVALALGSRGDVQPLAALVAALSRTGIDAVVACCADLVPVAESLGARAVGIPVDSREAADLVRGRRGRAYARRPTAQALALRTWVARIAPAVARTALTVCAPGDVLLSGILTRDLATALAEGRGCRPVTVLHTGQVPTAHRESHFGAQWFRGIPAYDRWGARLGWRIATGLGSPAARIVRAEYGLRHPRTLRTRTYAADRHPTILATSPLIVPPAPDWPAGVVQTGYLVPETIPDPGQDGHPGSRSAIAAFLADGSPPVYVGFGSMSPLLGRDGTRLILEAAALAGRRVITPAGADLAAGRQAPEVLAVDPVAHEWLLPRLAGTIHHGGAGTTWAAVRAGRPSVAVPFGVDQPYHAARVHALGLGPAPVSIHDVTPSRLAHLLTDLTSGRYADRAATVGRRARSEDGIRTTVAALDRLGLL